MKVKTRLFFAKCLISFSIVLIISGMLLYGFGNEELLHPIYDVRFIVGDYNEFISITTIDDEEINHNLVENDGYVNRDLFNEEQNFSIEQSNKDLRKKIENIYGVKIKYANETVGYKVGGMKTSAINDPVISKKALEDLNNVLSLYPKGFFQEIKSAGYPLTFYIIKCYSTKNVTGVTDSSSKNIVISIATDYDFIDTFHHEIYHYIEKYMIEEGATFTSWNSLNPYGFKYGNIDYSYAYARTFSDDSFFVNGYSMTDQYEDRASIFEYMMKDSKASCFNYGKTIWLKAKTMCEQMDYFFDSVNEHTTEYWERHVY